MVVLTIVAPSNYHTVYFDHPIPKTNYIRLLSCSIYNSWYNLRRGEITLTDKDENNKKYEASFTPGYYTDVSFAEAFKNAFLNAKSKLLQLSTHPQACCI